jgi:hypothetical protein
VLALVAGVVASCAVASSGTKSTSSSTTDSTQTSGSGTTSHPTTTTTTMPAAFRVGLVSFTWSEPGGTTVNPQTGGPLPGRKLTVQVRYPTTAGPAGAETPGATPATRFGPFPVVVFAHGFETMPVDYKVLLDTWVRAGFVVVAPIFPDENEITVEEDGGFTNAEVATRLETDQYNEPADIPFVLKQLQALDAKGSGAAVAGLLDLSKIVLAGQSDGANVVGALGFDKRYAADLAAMPSPPKGVAVLSGAPFQIAGNTYAASSASPAALFVQSDADTCNPPEAATTLYSEISADPAKWFVELLGASHLPPYMGQEPWAAVVEKATTTFFELETGWRSKGLSASSVTAAGTAANVAIVDTSSVPAIPNPATLGCAPPPPLP